MFSSSQNKTNNNSPILEVIILTFITVILVLIIYIVVFNISGNVSDTSDATVQVKQVSDGVQATVIRNENVAEFELVSDEGNSEVLFGPNAGDSAKFDDDSFDDDATNLGTGTISVIASLEDGSEEVLTSTDYDFN